MKRNLIYMLMAIFILNLTACATVYSVFDDTRTSADVIDDTSIATSIKSQYLNTNFGAGWDVSVYSYSGQVFLVGEAPDYLQSKFVEIAKAQKGVKSVTTHWFIPLKYDGSDFMTSTRLRANLINAKNLSSNRIEVEINAGRVVLLGIVNDSGEKAIAINAAKATTGVVSVKSYLLLPVK